MRIKYSFILFIGFIFLFSAQLDAQGNERDTVKDLNNDDNKIDTSQHYTSQNGWKSSTSIYLELAGKGVYSLNLDFRKKEKQAISFGIQYFDAFWSSVMYYYFSGKRYRFETGLGMSGVITGDGLEGLGAHGVIGYRYQKKNGLIFRIGFTPFLGIPLTSEGDYKFLPLIGLSLGYSF